MYYSKSTGGFYVTEIHGNNIPSDAVVISIEEHATLLGGQSAGKVIAPDVNGYPVLQDAQPSVVSPVTLSPWQIRKALNQLDLRAAVEAAVAASADQTLKDGWEFATEFVENEPFVVSMCAALGKTEAERHDLFVLGATL